jgi:hypothetical protein
MERNKLFYMGLILAIVLTACGAGTPTATSRQPTQTAKTFATSAPTQTAQTPDTPTVEATVTQVITSVDDYYPLDTLECESIQAKAGSAIKTRFSLITALFSDFGLSGTACIIEAFGTGSEFSMETTPQKLEAAFSDWTPNMQFMADGAMGTAMGFTRDSSILLISVSWEPSANASCPADQPISSCPLTAQQRLFTIVLKAAQR